MIFGQNRKCQEEPQSQNILLLIIETREKFNMPYACTVYTGNHEYSLVRCCQYFSVISNKSISEQSKTLIRTFVSRICTKPLRWGWTVGKVGSGEGGTLNFVCYIGWAPASCVYPQKYTVYQPYPKKYISHNRQRKHLQISAYPKNIPLTLLI